MSSIDEAVAALHSGAYDEASKSLETLGAAKPGGAMRARVLWGISQVLRRQFTDETVEVFLEAGWRSRNRSASIYENVLSLTGPFETLLRPEAAQELRLRIGDYFLRDEKADEAMPWLVTALAAAPEDPIAIYLEANCRFALYGERQAVQDMEAILARATADKKRAYFIGGQTAALWYRLGLAHDKLSHLDEAVRFLERAVALAPKNETPRVLLGDILIRLDRFDEAIRLLEAIPKLTDGYQFAVRLRAVALTRLGEADKALALLQEAAEIDPLGAITFLEMGRIYTERGELDRAELALARAFRTSPELNGLKSAIITLERHLGRHMDPDAGLPPVNEFTIPDQFALRLDDPALVERSDLLTAWKNYLRVMRALIIRDILSLHANSGMGYFWALAQPIVYVATLAAVYILAGHPAPLGTSVVAYLAAGIVPYVSFYARVESSVASSVRSNVSLLYFRQVTPLVLIGAAAVREYLTSLVCFVVIAGGIALYDKSVQLNDPLTILAALTCISLLGTVVGTLFGLGELAMPTLHIVETIMTRVMFFFSGALYYANVLPPRMREIALLNPLLHLIEFVRGGYFALYRPHYANWHYPLAFVGVGLALVMVLIYSTRRYVVAQ